MSQRVVWFGAMFGKAFGTSTSAVVDVLTFFDDNVAYLGEGDRRGAVKSLNFEYILSKIFGGAIKNYILAHKESYARWVKGIFEENEEVVDSQRLAWLKTIEYFFNNTYPGISLVIPPAIGLYSAGVDSEIYAMLKNTVERYGQNRCLGDFVEIMRLLRLVFTDDRGFARITFQDFQKDGVSVGKTNDFIQVIWRIPVGFGERDTPEKEQVEPVHQFAAQKHWSKVTARLDTVLSGAWRIENILSEVFGRSGVLRYQDKPVLPMRVKGLGRGRGAAVVRSPSPRGDVRRGPQKPMADVPERRPVPGAAVYRYTRQDGGVDVFVEVDPVNHLFARTVLSGGSDPKRSLPVERAVVRTAEARVVHNRRGGLTSVVKDTCANASECEEMNGGADGSVEETSCDKVKTKTLDELCKEAVDNMDSDDEANF